MKALRITLLGLLFAITVFGCGPTEPSAPVSPPPPGEASEAAKPSAPEPAVPVSEPPEPQEVPEADEPEAAAALETAPTSPEVTTPAIVRRASLQLLDEEGEGKLYRLGEHLVCVMSGTHAEMGFQHGRLLAKNIEHIFKEGYMKAALYDKGYTNEYINEQSARMEKHFPPEYVEEMKGIVEGLRAAEIQDIDYEAIRAAVCAAELQHHEPGSPPGCTNFAVFGQWTTDGRLLHGRNLDWDIRSGAQQDAVILVWRPKGGTPFMMPTWAGIIGGVSGMNAQGITIGEMTSSTTDETFDGIPLMIIMRRVLEEASGLEQAADIMQKGPRTLGWNFVIGDGKVPDARALEVDAAHCEVFAPMDEKESAETGHAPLPDAVRRTNHPCGKVHLAKLLQLHKDKLPPGLDLSDWNVVQGVLRTFNTWERYDWLGAQIQAQPGQIDVEQALQLLANGPVFCEVTLHSWVFDPKNQTAYVAIAGWDPPMTATKRAFAQLNLKEWFE